MRVAIVSLNHYIDENFGRVSCMQIIIHFYERYLHISLIELLIRAIDMLEMCFNVFI